MHKHQLCDGVQDCTDESDEMSSECLEMTEKTCARRYKHELPLPLPIAWLNDGLADCEDGADENRNKQGLLSQVCKVGSSFRFLPDGDVCENVFLCGLGYTEFVKIENLCIGAANVCSAADRACKRSRPFQTVMSEALEVNFSSGSNTKYISVAKRKACLRQKRHRAGSVSLFCAIVSSSD